MHKSLGFHLLPEMFLPVPVFTFMIRSNFNIQADPSSFASTFQSPSLIVGPFNKRGLPPPRGLTLALVLGLTIAHWGLPPPLSYRGNNFDFGSGDGDSKSGFPKALSSRASYVDKRFLLLQHHDAVQILIHVQEILATLLRHHSKIQA